jgi:hypothetical protein
MKWILIAVTLAALGCKKDKSADDECVAAIGKGVDQTIASRRGSATSVDDVANRLPGRLKTTLVKLCKEDKWSPEVLQCFREASDIKLCKEKLTVAQRQRYSAEIVQVMVGNRPRPGMIKMPPGHDAVAPPGSNIPAEPVAPPAGSAPAPAGSAPAGSAAPK